MKFDTSVVSAIREPILLPNTSSEPATGGLAKRGGVGERPCIGFTGAATALKEDIVDGMEAIDLFEME